VAPPADAHVGAAAGRGDPRRDAGERGAAAAAHAARRAARGQVASTRTSATSCSGRRPSARPASRCRRCSSAASGSRSACGHPLQPRVATARRARRRCGCSTGEPFRGMPADRLARELGGHTGSAGLFSTAPDLARFTAMIANGGALDGVRVSTPGVVGRTASASSRAPGAARSAGPRSARMRSPTRRSRARAPLAFGHTGWTGTSIWIDPARRPLGRAADQPLLRAAEPAGAARRPAARRLPRARRQALSRRPTGSVNRARGSVARPRPAPPARSNVRPRGTRAPGWSSSAGRGRS
jgi:hypothetical protein